MLLISDLLNETPRFSPHFRNSIMKDDLRTNVFLRQIMEQHSALYALSAEKSYVIVVPHSASFSQVGISLTLENIQNHILQKNRFQRNSMVSLNGKCITLRRSMEDGKLMLCTSFGYDEVDRISAVLNEELFYDDKFNKIRVLSVDKPLAGRYTSIGTDSRSNEVICPALALPLIDPAAIELDVSDKAFQLRTSVDTFEIELDHCVPVRDMTSFTSDRVFLFLESLLLSLKITWGQILAFSIEEYVHARLHDKVFIDLCRIYENDRDFRIAEVDVKGEQYSSFVEELSLENPSLSFLQSFNASHASKHLSSLNQCNTPIAKLRTIVQSCSLLVVKDIPSAGLNDLAVSSDEMIPLLAVVILQSGVKHLTANLEYAHHFTNPPTRRKDPPRELINYSELMFYRSTFIASVGLIGEHFGFADNSAPQSIHSRSNSATRFPRPEPTTPLPNSTPPSEEKLVVHFDKKTTPQLGKTPEPSEFLSSLRGTNSVIVGRLKTTRTPPPKTASNHD